MELGSIFLFLALLVLVALFVSRPLFGGDRAEKAPKPASDDYAQPDRLRSTLLAERDRILGALQELDFDFTLGKIPEDDYPSQRKILLRQGADVLRQLDAMTSDARVEDAEARLEAAIAARRADLASSHEGHQPGLWPDQRPVMANGRKPVAASEPDDDLEIMLANRRRVRQEKAGGFCPKCGGAVQKSDRFCPKCGANLSGAKISAAKVGGEKTSDAKINGAKTHKTL